MCELASRCALRGAMEGERQEGERQEDGRYRCAPCGGFQHTLHAAAVIPSARQRPRTHARISSQLGVARFDAVWLFVAPAVGLARNASPAAYANRRKLHCRKIRRRTAGRRWETAERLHRLVGASSPRLQGGLWPTPRRLSHKLDLLVEHLTWTRPSSRPSGHLFEHRAWH